MNTVEKNEPGDIKFGRFSYTHARFLMVLMCLAVAGYLLADLFGNPLQPGAGLLGKVTSHQMIWGLLMIPVGAFGYLSLKRSGHPVTARYCAIVAIFFALGCGYSVI